MIFGLISHVADSRLQNLYLALQCSRDSGTDVLHVLVHSISSYQSIINRIILTQEPIIHRKHHIYPPTSSKQQRLFGDPGSRFPVAHADPRSSFDRRRVPRLSFRWHVTLHVYVLHGFMHSIREELRTRTYSYTHILPSLSEENTRSVSVCGSDVVPTSLYKRTHITWC